MRAKGPISKAESAFIPPKKEKEAKPRKAINKVSAKRLVENAEYSTLRFMFLTKNNKCQICNIATSEQVHHKHSGKDRAKHYLDVPTWMALCHDCHNILHLNPKEARENGHLF